MERGERPIGAHVPGERARSEQHEPEANVELCEFIRLQPGLILSLFRARGVSNEPAFLKRRERILAALRQIGAPM